MIIIRGGGGIILPAENGHIAEWIAFIAFLITLKGKGAIV